MYKTQKPSKTTCMFALGMQIQMLVNPTLVSMALLKVILCGNLLCSFFKWQFCVVDTIYFSMHTAKF